MPFVLDSSVALAWILPDEHSDSVDLIADRLENDFAVVPAVWPLEILNALLVASRRARISAGDIKRSLSDLAALPIEVETIAMAEMLDAISSVAQRHNITSYDAAYVELAKRRGLAVATLDRKLRQVVGAERLSAIP
jgi:predicted nucleic acid-binding protein